MCLRREELPLRFFLRPIIFETRIHVANAAIGIITELVKKSKKSKNCIPIILMLPKGP